MTDVVITWLPTTVDDRGVFFAEIKMYAEPLSDDQIKVLNLLTAQGHKCGVYRHPDTLIEALIEAGAPIARESRW